MPLRLPLSLGVDRALIKLYTWEYTFLELLLRQWITIIFIMKLNLTQTDTHMVYFKMQNTSYFLQLKAKSTWRQKYMLFVQKSYLTAKWQTFLVGAKHPENVLPRMETNESIKNFLSPANM